MKKSIVISLMLFICVSFSILVFADEQKNFETSDGFIYQLLDDGTAIITAGTFDPTEELVIPEEVDGYLVTAIGDSAFWPYESLLSITIPDSINSIGVNPFLNNSGELRFNVASDHPFLAVIEGVLFSKPDKRLICCPNIKDSYEVPEGIERIGANAFCGNRLKSIILPDSLTTIEDSAFISCEYLTSITLPNSINSIGVNPFSRGKNEISINVASDHPYLAVIDDVLFSKPDKRLICCPNIKETYDIPEGIEIIESCAFYGCESLMIVNFPESLRNIGNYAFGNCNLLTKITLPEGLTNIGDRVFYWCDNLESIILPDSLKSIGYESFPDNDDLIITVSRESYAESYCKEMGYNYAYADVNDWLND